MAKRMKQAGVRLSEEEHRKLKELADSSNFLTMSTLIRTAIQKTYFTNRSIDEDEKLA